MTNGKATSYDEIISKIEYTLKGYEYKDGQYIDVKNQPYLDPKRQGYSKVMTVIRGHVGDHMSFSNLNRQFIRASVRRLMTDLFLDFNKNKTEYGFKNKEDIDIVLDVIQNNIIATMLRAVGGQEGKMYYRTLSQNVNMQTGGEPGTRL